MRDRMTLESQRREEIITYNRELREKVNAQKAKVRRSSAGGIRPRCRRMKVFRGAYMV